MRTLLNDINCFYWIAAKYQISFIGMIVGVPARPVLSRDDHHAYVSPLLLGNPGKPNRAIPPGVGCPDPLGTFLCHGVNAPEIGVQIPFMQTGKGA